MKQNDVNVIKEFLEKLEDTVKLVPEESAAVLGNLQELKEIVNKLSTDSEYMDSYSLSHFYQSIDEKIAS